MIDSMKATRLERCFHTCFITDVKVCRRKVTLTDSSRQTWILYLTRERAKQFKKWMSETFLAGKPQTLTMFEYVMVSSDFKCVNLIKKFIFARK